jgi:hypothetical protein
LLFSQKETFDLPNASISEDMAVESRISEEKRNGGKSKKGK